MALTYILFQRPPPYVANGPFKVSINLTNDLRDEQPLYSQPRRISLDWVVQLKAGDYSLVTHISTLDWSNSNDQYTAIPVSLPSRQDLSCISQQSPLLRHGRPILRLAAWEEVRGNRNDSSRGPKRRKHDISIRPSELSTRLSYQVQEYTSSSLLPILSEPIWVWPGHPPSRSPLEGKQTHSSRQLSFRSLDIRQNSVATIAIREEIGFDLSRHVWDASIHLIAYLASRIGPDHDADDAPDRTFVSQRRSAEVIELGSGTGVVSLALATMLHQANIVTTESADEGGTPQIKGLLPIIASDLDGALPLLRSNIEATADLLECSPNGLVEAVELDWTCPLPARFREAKERERILLVSDCTYNPTYFIPLLDKIFELLPSPGHSASSESLASSSCFLAQKKRHHEEARFWAEAGKRFRIEQVCSSGDLKTDTEAASWGIWKLYKR